MILNLWLSSTILAVHYIVSSVLITTLGRLRRQRQDKISLRRGRMVQSMLRAQWTQCMRPPEGISGSNFFTS
ncbi:hypothetical protein BKA82DRAFT_4130863 [Pisolithus tinctorius]|nr:hypothetical protein BKA82DRAFT_4130863 [Pisolithus tinctorius]